jgi:hypothetical protein
LLKLDPITPQVRAAVFRVLATLPGVSSIGQVTDPLGRTGDGIELGAAGLPGGEVLVIAPASGALLADEYLTAGTGSSAASGAVPGPTSCPADTKVIRFSKGTGCVPPADITRVQGKKIKAIRLVGGGVIQLLDQPQLAVPAGTVISYEVVVSSGWTDAQPALPPAADQFSSATQGKG